MEGWMDGRKGGRERMGRKRRKMKGDTEEKKNNAGWKKGWEEKERRKKV